MKVSVETKGEVIWFLDTDKGDGMAALGYLRDGTQKKIIAALEAALIQAKGEQLSWYNREASKLPFAVESGKIFIEEAPIKNASISVGSDERLTISREAINELQQTIIENAMIAQFVASKRIGK